MDLDKYQEMTKKYDLFKETDNFKEVGFMEKVLGLVGEAGETADKVKKILRDKDGVLSEDDKMAIIKELGDTLWYIAAISRYLGVPLAKVAEVNVEKLRSRQERGVLRGSGDER